MSFSKLLSLTPTLPTRGDFSLVELFLSRGDLEDDDNLSRGDFGFLVFLSFELLSLITRISFSLELPMEPFLECFFVLSDPLLSLISEGIFSIDFFKSPWELVFMR